MNISSQGDQRPNVTVHKYKPIAELRIRRQIASQELAKAITRGDAQERERLFKEVIEIEGLLQESQAAMQRHLGRKQVYQT